MPACAIASDRATCPMAINTRPLSCRHQQLSPTPPPVLLAIMILMLELRKRNHFFYYHYFLVCRKSSTRVQYSDCRRVCCTRVEPVTSAIIPASMTHTIVAVLHLTSFRPLFITVVTVLLLWGERELNLNLNPFVPSHPPPLPPSHPPPPAHSFRLVPGFITFAPVDSSLPQSSINHQ